MFLANTALRKVLQRRNDDSRKKDSTRQKISLFCPSRTPSSEISTPHLTKTTVQHLHSDQKKTVYEESACIGSNDNSTNLPYTLSGTYSTQPTSTLSLSLRHVRKVPTTVHLSSNFVIVSRHGPSRVYSLMGLHSTTHATTTTTTSTTITKSQDAVYSSFMRAHKCYDLIPTSTKLVVFDTQLKVKKAFFALIYNGVRAAPLWDSKKQKFVGMLTISDFIRILHKYYTKNGSQSEGIQGLEQHEISTWREELERDGHLKPLASISPSESLYQAVHLLCKEKVHRLPVMEESSGNIAFILTHKRLIKFLYLYVLDLPRPSFMDKTPRELGLGTWNNVSTITEDTPLIDVMGIFLSKRVSALPVLDKNGRVVDIYAKFDAINLAADKSYNDLNITAREALKHRVDWFEGVRCCSPNDSLMTVVEMIVRAEVHRLVVVDDDKKVVGIISLSDILRFMVVEPPITSANNDGSDFTMDDAAESCEEVEEVKPCSGLYRLTMKVPCPCHQDREITGLSSRISHYRVRRATVLLI